MGSDGLVARTLTSLGVALAAAVVYFGIGIMLAVISANQDVKAVAVGVGYVAVAVATPVLIGLHQYRSHKATLWGGVRSAVILCLVVNAPLLPFAAAVMAM